MMAQLLIWLWFLLLGGVVAARKSNVQLCYIAAGEVAPSNLIPCYTDWGAPQASCCLKGDMCLEGNSCYDQLTGVTYQYGCTDLEYKDKNCPRKCHLDTG
ncbi:uncharacterized protein BDR25DRAFT_257070, partial [Lindgomyces ingoldianus]